ncbi:MAG: M23 family metallopeptidase [Eubacteriales bacterium]
MLPYQIRNYSKIRITSTYGHRILYGKPDWHPALDMVSDTGKNVVSLCDGVVRSSTILSRETDKTGTWTYGNYIIITAADYTQFLYAHLKQRFVNVGERVRAGQLIGVEGTTGNSSGSHLHLEIRKDGEKINPAEYLGLANKIMTVSAKACDFSPWVSKRCNFEAQTRDYLNKYTYAAELWHRLWINMLPTISTVSYSNAKSYVANTCSLESQTVKYLDEYQYADELWRRLAGRLVA